MKTMLRRINHRRPLFNHRAFSAQAATNTLKIKSSVVFRRVSGALNLAVGFNPRGGERNVPASRQRRLNSIVADAT
jgi:hypothetical protein